MQYDRWKLEGKTIGGGGQGQVELVTDASGRNTGHFALKKLKDDRRIHRFRAEVEAVTSLNHPNIIRILDFSIDTAPYYYVMEFCEGGSLEKIGPSQFKGDIDKSVAIVAPICEALAAAHAHVTAAFHRDVKPSNILLRADGTPVLADFGICYRDNNEYVTLHEEAMGPLNYIAPEMESGRRYLGEPSDKTDIYALGKVLYWMLSGGSIFGREDHRANPLTRILGEQRWEHVHMVLDEVIREKPSERLDLNRFLWRLKQVQQLITGNFAPLKPSIGINCRFCGIGRYQRYDYSTSPDHSEIGFVHVGGVVMGALRCDYCGHLELFNFRDMHDRRPSCDWWNK